MTLKYDHFPQVLHSVRQDFITMGRTSDRGEWQSKRDDRPQSKVYEVYDVVFKVPVGNDPFRWQTEVEPNLPWAEDHFQERVGGVPLNPGEQYKNWPWYEQGVEEHKPGGRFSHTYMERFWPGGAFGNLNHVVQLLRDRPLTRQAYLTVWWPHDAKMSVDGERVPCTLGYHFQAVPTTPGQPHHLKASYFMRSCDYFRYLRDDVYMAGRLLQWVSNKVGMNAHMLTVHIANLHIFDAEVDRLREEHNTEIARRMRGAF